MRVYITGIEGMLGSAIAYQHMRAGDEVFGCDIWKADSKYPKIDIRKYPQLFDDIDTVKPDRVYHCAAMLGVQNTEQNPEVCKQINEDGTANVAEASRRAKVKELVFLSSSEVYGHGYDFKPFSEDSGLLGDNVYAESKKKGELIVRGHADKMKVVVTRMFNCFGLFQVKQFFIPKAIGLCLSKRRVPIFGSLDNRRSYLLSYDAAQHVIDVANRAGNKEVVNVAHPTSYTLGETYDIVANACGGGVGVTLRTKEYDDRDVKRDVPNRLAVIHKLQAFSSHVPTALPDAIKFVVSRADTLRNDWDYERTVI